MATRSTGLALMGSTLAVALLLVLLGGIYWGESAKWQGRSNADCNDYNPCTSNLILPDGSCVTPPRTLHNGSDCAAEDRCYYFTDNGTAVPKACITGVCTAPRENCRGYCTVDSDCTDYPLPLRYDALNSSVIETDAFCYAQSCVTSVVGGHTSDCASWIDLTDSVNFYTRQCLFISYDDFGGAFAPGVCFFRYNCAPFNFYNVTAAPTAAPTSAPTEAPTAKKRDVVEVEASRTPRASRTQAPFTVRPRLVVRPQTQSNFVFPRALRMQFAREPMTGEAYRALADRLSQGRRA